MRRRRWMGVVLAILAAACGGDSAPSAPSVGGDTLALVRINGRGLPAAATKNDGSPTRVYAGFLLLSPDGTYTREQRDSTPQPTGSVGIAESFDYGTWTQRGDSVFTTSVLTVTKYPAGRGARTSARITIALGSATYEFARQ